jgi:flagella basal body P-ring formation protein FlgA
MKMYDKFLPGIYRKLLLSVLFLQFSNSSVAATYTMTELSAQASAWLQQEIQNLQNDQLKLELYPLDARLADKECESPLNFSLVTPKIQRQNTVRIHCADNSSWQLFVPVRMSQMITAVISSQKIPAGSYITAEMLKTADIDLLQSRGKTVSAPEQIIGARSKKALNAGQIVTQSDLCLVCKGDIVTIEGISSTLSVSTQATALQDGAFGDTVRLQNVQSQRVVSAVITAVKKAEIKL